MLKTLKKWSAIPLVKYALIAVAAAMWTFGLSDQIPDFTQTAKYLGISALMVTAALLA